MLVGHMQQNIWQVRMKLVRGACRAVRLPHDTTHRNAPFGCRAQVRVVPTKREHMWTSEDIWALCVRKKKSKKQHNAMLVWGVWHVPLLACKLLAEMHNKYMRIMLMRCLVDTARTSIPATRPNGAVQAALK